MFGFDPSTLLVKAAVLVVMLGVAFPIHEFAHALAAYRLGDGTAKLMGRLTLDPRAHFDPTGGLLLAISVLFTGFGFGWAKPTPYNPMNLQGGRWGEAHRVGRGADLEPDPRDRRVHSAALHLRDGHERRAWSSCSCCSSSRSTSS